MNAQAIPNMVPQPISDKPCPSLAVLKSGLQYFKTMHESAPANDCKRTLYSLAVKQLTYFTGLRQPYFSVLLPFSNF